MDEKECLQILRNIKDVSFATVDERGNPQVRIIDVMLIQGDTLIFCTARGKNFYRELMASGKAAIIALCKDFSTIRLNGRVERLSNQKRWIDQIFEKNPSMKDIYPGEARYILEAFGIRDGEIEHFELGKKPICRTSYLLGKGCMTKKGFYIHENCIGCGKCVKLCPQGAIQAGCPAVIEEEHCLHCGLCYENCPVEAIGLIK